MVEYHEERVDDVPEHVNDKNGHISLVLMGMAVLLLVLLVVAVVQAM